MWSDSFLIYLENSESGEIGLRLANIGVCENLAGIERHFAENDVLPRDRVADYVYRSNTLGRLLGRYLIDDAGHARRAIRIEEFRPNQRRHASVAVIILDGVLVFLHL